jgi:NADH dehydrogenase
MSVRVVVLGTGFGGFTVARELAGSREVTVTAVNRENYTLFTPLLPEVASGSIEPRHIAQPFRTAVPNASFALGEITAVDFGERSVALRHPVTGATSSLGYDQLVIALGSVTGAANVPGAEEHALRLLTLADAIRIRTRIIAALETAAAPGIGEDERRAELTIVVVGGGFNGVEAAGELQAFARAAARQYRGIDPSAISVALVSDRPRLLEELAPRFGERAHDVLAARGIAIELDDAVASVDAGGVTLKSGKRHAAKTVIWSAGVRVPKLVAELDLAHTPRHAIRVNPDLSVPDRPGVWALGDCADIPRAQGGTYPQTAQDALREGVQLARNIIATVRGKKTRAFDYRSLGMMVSLGAREGLADVGGRLVAGFPAWMLWRGYYLSRLPGAYRKARVVLDWSLAVPFREDIASIE